MAKKLLITFGCSWTFGVAAGYKSEMSRDQLMAISWNEDICYENSWRGKLCQRFDLENRNFAVGGSSNQRQLRLAIEYFNSNQFMQDRKDFSDISVLWGITSTARNEIWSNSRNKYFNFFYTADNEFSRFFVLNSYHHEAELRELRQQILHWNTLFRYLDINNHWFDSFNTHDYINSATTKNKSNSVSWEQFRNHYESIAGPDWPSCEKYLDNDWSGVAPDIKKEIQDDIQLIAWYDLCFDLPKIKNSELLPRFIGNQNRPCDLMSWLCIKNNIEIEQQRKYHLSGWAEDDTRVSKLVSQGLLNPFSNHPTGAAHDMIADFLGLNADLG